MYTIKAFPYLNKRFLQIMCMLILAAGPYKGQAQNSGIGISTTSLSDGVILEIGRQWGGLLVPRLALKKYADITTVPQPITNGTLLYNVGSAVPEGFYYWKQDRWNNLTTATSNIYTNDGDLPVDRTLGQGDHYLELSSATGKNAWTIKRTKNSIEQGLSFQNSDATYTASIYMDTPNGSALKMATGSRGTNINGLSTTLTLNDDKSILFNNYGQDQYTGTVTQFLGVDNTGMVVEKPATDIFSTIYDTNGTLTGPRIINTADYLLRLNNSNDRGMQIQPADPTDATSPFTFFTYNAFDFEVNTNKTLQLLAGYSIRTGNYGQGAITGSPSYTLGFDGSGNIIELDQPARGMQYYTLSYPSAPVPQPSILDKETNLKIAKSGFYTGNLNLNNDAATMMPTSADGFIIKITGTYNVQNAGVFNLTSNSDDGARVYIDDSLILDIWIESGDANGSGSAYLSKGKHKFTFYYYENQGNQKFTFKWGANPDGITSGSIIKATQFTIE